MGPNDVLRFVLELVGLGALGLWGWRSAEGLLALGLAVGVPLFVALLWGVFRVPNDPGPAPIAIPGPLRLLLEAVVFSLAVVALVDTGFVLAGVALAGVLVVHYVIARDRVGRLLGRR